MCCTTIAKDHILTVACQEADEAFVRNSQGNAPGSNIVPSADLGWNYNTQEEIARCARFLEALTGGMKKGIQKPVNYEKLKTITQKKMRNQPAFRAGWKKPLGGTLM